GSGRGQGRRAHIQGSGQGTARCGRGPPGTSMCAMDETPAQQPAPGDAGHAGTPGPAGAAGTPAAGAGPEPGPRTAGPPPGAQPPPAGQPGAQPPPAGQPGAQPGGYPPPAGGYAPPSGRTGGDAFFDSIRRTGIVRSDERWVGGVAGGLAMRLG